MYCKICGKVVPDGTNYCSQCAEEIPSVGFLEAAKLFFTNYANFKGRSRRSEYWWAYLFTFIISGVLGYVLPIVSGIWALLVFVPSLAISVRRLHDIGKSGWYYLFICIPLVGQIMLLVWACTDSKEDNQWGPNPKFRPMRCPIPVPQPAPAVQAPKAQPAALPKAEPEALPLTAVPSGAHRLPETPGVSTAPVQKPIPMPAAFSATLILCTGPMAGRQFTYRAGEKAILGRSQSGANLLLNGYDKVSGTHCRIEVGSNAVTVTDLGSTNGTVVNNQRLMPNVPVQVAHGGMIFLADSNCAFQVKFN